ncbi:MAG: hypothetical protein K2W96_06875, partial [Gemmataceae bacterium]|nr:hypothetical protein [Gemmataceae bacterium]
MSDNDSVSGRDIKNIETIWGQVAVSHSTDAVARKMAQEAVLARYKPAVLRYLRACLGDPDQADEVWQNFSVRFVEGAFRNADPEKGRFRDLLKTAIYHLVMDHHKKRRRQMPNLSPDAPEPAQEESSIVEPDDQFAKAWRNELLNRCWEALATEERLSKRPLHSVLRCRAAHPDKRSHELAGLLGAQMGKPATADWVRK